MDKNLKVQYDAFALFEITGGPSVELTVGGDNNWTCFGPSNEACPNACDSPDWACLTIGIPNNTGCVPPPPPPQVACGGLPNLKCNINPYCGQLIGCTA